MKKEKQSVVGELIYGINPVVELIKARRRKLITLYTTNPTPRNWKLIDQIMPSYPVPIQYVSRDVLTRMAETTDHQGVVAWVQPFGFRKKSFTPATHPFLVLLDGIQDPRNVGAIIRSAYCTGASGLILVEKQGCLINSTVCKASAGLVEHTDIALFPSIQAAIIDLKKMGYQLYATGFNGNNACTLDFSTTPLCLIIGSEGSGISDQAHKASTLITLPQRNPTLSYNASVAAGIMLFMIGRAKKTI